MATSSPKAPSSRTERVARLLPVDDAEQLRLTALQAIDHAYKSAAEVAEMRAVLDGIHGRIGLLQEENARLREALEEMRQDRAKVAATRAWRAASHARVRLVTMSRRARS